VALLRLLLGGKLLHGAAVLSRRPRGGRGPSPQPPTQQHRQQWQQQQPRRQPPKSSPGTRARRVTRLHDSGSPVPLPRGDQLAPSAASSGAADLPRWPQPQLLLPLLAPGQGCAKLRGRGTRSAQDPQAPPPARAPVHPPPRGAARPPGWLSGRGELYPPSARRAASPSTAPPSCWPCPSVPGQTVWGRQASSWVVATTSPKRDGRGHSLLARDINLDQFIARSPDLSLAPRSEFEVTGVCGLSEPSKVGVPRSYKVMSLSIHTDARAHTHTHIHTTYFNFSHLSGCIQSFRTPQSLLGIIQINCVQVSFRVVRAIRESHEINTSSI
jgi:hypothetical protein